MKRRPKRRKPAREPQTFLVGNSGKVSRDERLRQLRMTKKYKTFLMEQEREERAKISEMSELVEQYKNLSSLMCTLKKENVNSSNADLLQELEVMRTKFRERLFHLDSMFTDSIPETLNESVQEILNCRGKFSKHKKRVRGFLVSGEKRELKRCRRVNTKANIHVVNNPPRTNVINSTNKRDQKIIRTSVSNVKGSRSSSIVARNGWSSNGFKSQIFLRKSNSQLQKISIDLLSLGNNLYDVLAQELGDVTKYKLMFGTKEVKDGCSNQRGGETEINSCCKKVDKETTLFEQEIHHGSTVDLVLPLFGGVGKKTQKRKKAKGNARTNMKSQETPMLEETSETQEAPRTELEAEKWEDPAIQRWFEKISEILEITIEEVPVLKTLTVYDVKMLEKKEWKDMSPVYGHILFNMWKKDEQTFADGVKEERGGERASPTPIVKAKNEVEERSSEPDELRLNLVPQKTDAPKSSRKVFFGNAETLDETEKQFLVEDFEDDASIPQFGSVITVTGVCLNTPLVHGNVATLFIRDDPRGAASFYNKIKIVVARSERNKNQINSLVDDLSADMFVGVKGRVEKLNKDDDIESSDSCKMLKFKLAVDSDDHVVFSAETKPPKLTRQLSQNCWPEHALSENGDELNLKVGDFLLGNDLKMVCCAENTSDEQILQYVVAFKNSFDGEIFVGVKENGEITGMELSSGEIKNWCETVSKAIGTLLPGANEGADICHNIREANVYVDRRRCFVCALPLYNDNSKRICWIHVPEGEARVHFTKPSDVHAFKRIGAENKRIKDYDHLFNDLESLASRRIEPVPEEDYDEEDDEQNEEKSESEEKYKILKEVKHEDQHLELKMIFGDNPVKIIQEKYIGPYACGFLNSEGGSIFFGIEEDEQTKTGHIVGIVLSPEEKKELAETTVKTLRNFYPPVRRSQFRIKFHPVRVPLELIVKDKGGGKVYAMITGPSDEIGKKWPKMIRNKLPRNSCAVIPIRPKCFCVVATKQAFDGGNLTNLLEQFVKNNPKFKLQNIGEKELNTILKNNWVIQLKVTRSPYPIHMIKTIDTHVFETDKKGQLCITKLSLKDLMHRFQLDFSAEFNVDQFLKHVKTFDNAGNSYILITSPFHFHGHERDLYGLVIPKWTLTIDLDQHPKQPGHLYDLFQILNDRYQTERDRFLKTPKDSKLDLNPDHAVCWLAARGYEEDEKSLSEESHAKWNKTHRSRVRELLNEDLKTSVKPNSLNVVVLWDEGHDELIKSLRTILEDVISLNGDDSTEITLVCATAKARSYVCSKIIEPLQEDNWDTISEDRVYVAPPYVLARFLSLKLPSPYRPEDDYQVPHKKFFSSGGAQIVPQILPQRLRQNLSGYIDVMYMKTGKKPDEKTLNKERKNFFSGSAITNDGLHGDIAIRRTKMDDLEKKFKALSHDKKSHVSLVFVRVDRGAGSTTMCLQFLYQQHKLFPCAQLEELKNGLESHIEEMNKKTRLPLLLFVDENIAHLPEFLEFVKKVERRHVNVIFIVIEPAEIFSGSESLNTRKTQKSRPKSARDSSLYGPSPYQIVELRRRLDEDEMEQLVKVLAELVKGKKKELNKFKEASNDDKPRTFAHFSLLAFGNEFKGLKWYVKFRLSIADERQRAILAFLSLTHVYTDYFLPASALVRFINEKNAILEDVLEHKYLQELLSPPIDGSDSRRISFHEVAKEILKQLSGVFGGAQVEGDTYWNYIKYVSVEIAKHVLSKYITTRKIDRLTRKLFVTSEYESEKFSYLIRSMKTDYRDTARDTLKELVDVFDEKERHSSIRAHLRAHLAKYHMIEYKDFTEAKELIEAAIREQDKDPLLHHIHGDIIRLYILVLVEKMKKKDDLEIIVRYADKSSKCFEFVRSKRPQMSHGFISDAMVRITVMQAGIKLMGGKNVSFVDYLIKRIDEIKELGDEDISPNSRYLLSLICDAHEYLDERCNDYEQKEKWKETFLSCIGDLKNITRLCDKIKQEKDCRSFIGCSGWLHEILVQTQILHHALEIEHKVLSPQELEVKLKKMEEYGLHSKFGDRFMKFWIRYSRQRISVPSLQEVKKRVYDWSNKMKKKRVASPQAEFYNFVVHVLMALKDPSDREKMDKAEKLTKQQQSKRYNKKEDFILPLEWLHPKSGRHIESIDCLLHHDDLIKGTSISSKSDKRRPIEGSLFEKNITQWEGTITAVRSDWQGIITFKKRLPVRFVPLSAQPSMPSAGDTVKFCLSFDGFGLSAWRVMREAGTHPSDLSDIVSRDDDSSSDYSEPEDADDNYRVAPSLCSIDIAQPDEKPSLSEHKSQERHDKTVPKMRSKTHWDDCREQRMQGVVSYTNPETGFGFIENPNIKDKLFFHASQLMVPVKTLEGNIVKDMLLDFIVEKLTERTRAADIRVLKDKNLQETMLEELRKKRPASSSTAVPVHANEYATGRLVGSVLMFDVSQGYGFIKSDNDKSGNDIFFSRKCLTSRGQLPKVRDRVEFSVRKTSDGRLEATEILVQNKSISSNKWNSFINAGIQEGFVNSTTDDGGTINNSKVTGPKRNLQFRNKDVLNKPKTIVTGSKMHFEVIRRGGQCFAVKINVIEIPEETGQAENSEASFHSNDF